MYKQCLRRMDSRQAKLKTLLKEAKDKNMIESSAYGFLKKPLVRLHMYVRNTLGLPHPGTLRRWQSSVNCHPGFLEQSHDCASWLADQTGERMYSPIVDEMSLRTELVWKDAQHSYTGHVD
ncbi:THAP domain-containing protein 9 [Plakobranchus ocellatus]|uniref:THAP domain-containing protein 9 n=1 Tax=Plakobranchus ocellatus TaxID=259542 RepID=A0AAV4C312_9GAST|nr:THAP domain-containing protein 9 [Plakobranchus ocellatus]